MKKPDRSPANSRLKVKTSHSLHQTKPVKATRIQRLQKNLQKANRKEEKDTAKEAVGRTKPVSQIEIQNRMDSWFIPARIGYLLNGLYFLFLSAVSFLGIFSNYKIIKPFFTLPFETSFSSYFLLEMAAVFALMVSVLFFYAARNPRHYRWFYFLLIIAILPYHFFSNLQKMQIELPIDFQNYLYFDTIIMAIFWAAYLISLYPYLKLNPKK